MSRIAYQMYARTFGSVNRICPRSEFRLQGVECGHSPEPPEGGTPSGGDALCTLRCGLHFTAAKESPERTAAEKSIAAINAARKAPAELGELRKESEALKKKVEATSAKSGKR